MRFLHPLGIVAALLIASNVSTVHAAQKGKSNNSAQERKDDAKVQAQRQDVNEAEKKLQAASKEYKAAESEAKKSLEAVATAKKAMQETSERLTSWISKNIGIPEAIEAQRDTARRI